MTGSSVEWGFKPTSFRTLRRQIVPPARLDAGAWTAPSPTRPARRSADPRRPSSTSRSRHGHLRAGSAGRPLRRQAASANGSGTVLFCKRRHGFSVALTQPDPDRSTAPTRGSSPTSAPTRTAPGTRFQRADLADARPQRRSSRRLQRWRQHAASGQDIPAKLSADGASSAIGALPRPASRSTRSPADAPRCSGRCWPQCTHRRRRRRPDHRASTSRRAALPTLTEPGHRQRRHDQLGLPPLPALLGPGHRQLPAARRRDPGYPGNMGGGATPAPSRRRREVLPLPGRQLRLPKQATAANPSDDRLIATSIATVGFCNPAAGNYGVVISKPTLVIDGANSRLLANAYSYSGGFPTPSPKGWLDGARRPGRPRRPPRSAAVGASSTVTGVDRHGRPEIAAERRHPGRLRDLRNGSAARGGPDRSLSTAAGG